MISWLTARCRRARVLGRTWSTCLFFSSLFAAGRSFRVVYLADCADVLLSVVLYMHEPDDRRLFADTIIVDIRSRWSLC